AAAGEWERHGRGVLNRMNLLGVSSMEASSWTAMLLALSRLGRAEESIEVTLIDT
ncbi:unnamed protein product, partial [Choristocarpus tenellus]